MSSRTFFMKRICREIELADRLDSTFLLSIKKDILVLASLANKLSKPWASLDHPNKFQILLCFLKRFMLELPQ